MLIYLIPYSLFFTFLLLIMLSVENIMCQDIVLRKPIPLMCIRSQHRVTSLYLSRIPLGKFGTMIVSTCWILWWTVFPLKCGTLGQYMSSDILTSYHIIGRLCIFGIIIGTIIGISIIFWDKVIHQPGWIHKKRADQKKFNYITIMYQRIPWIIHRLSLSIIQDWINIPSLTLTTTSFYTCTSCWSLVIYAGSKIK